MPVKALAAAAGPGPPWGTRRPHCQWPVPQARLGTPTHARAPATRLLALVSAAGCARVRRSESPRLSAADSTGSRHAGGPAPAGHGRGRGYYPTSAPGGRRQTPNPRPARPDLAGKIAGILPIPIGRHRENIRDFRPDPIRPGFREIGNPDFAGIGKINPDARASGISGSGRKPGACGGPLEAPEALPVH
jgi:hypothetical protein